MKMELTQELLKELLHYEPETGVFTWKYRENGFESERIKNSWNAKHEGKRAGSIQGVRTDDLYYLVIGLKGASYKAHRLAFLYMDGSLPEDMVDHEDGDGLNNRWKNLRKANNTINTQNAKRYKSNTSGVVGVNWQGTKGKWRAYINIRGTQTYLGDFLSKQDAISARRAAEVVHGYHPNHGRFCGQVTL